MSESRNGRTDAELSKAGLKECLICHYCWSLRGFLRHYNPCKARDADRQKALQATLDTRGSSALALSSQVLQRYSGDVYSTTVASLLGTESPLDYELASSELNPIDSGNREELDTGNAMFPGSSGDPEKDRSNVRPQHPEEGSIKVFYHPRPNRCHTETGLMRAPSSSRPAFYRGRIAPWAPFRTHGDFRFAKTVANSDLDEGGINELLDLYHTASDSSVTLRNYKEMEQIQDRAANLLAPFKRVNLSVPYRSGRNAESQLELEMWMKPLNDWLLELVQNPELQPHLHFDAMQKFRWDHGRWMRFVDEPWTADNWAKMQSSLPNDGIPLSIHLYADKSVTSSSGTKKLYPVVARLSNLPREIRNGHGVGGGRVVALIPVIEDRPVGLAESGFANLKCAVWHCAVGKLLGTIQTEARMGHAIEFELHHALGLEKKMWRLFPVVSIVSADYDEQIIVACHRGTNCLSPCVRCLVPGDMLHNLLYQADMRDPQSFIVLLEQVEGLNVTETNAHLKAQGYRPVRNAFLLLGSRTDLFQALSYDTLHNDDLGRWGKHLWPLLRENLGTETDQVQLEFNKRVDAVPPWPELNHFSRALSMDFSDGTKYEDLLRVVLHGAIGLDRRYLSLIRLIRLQAEIRILAGLEIHTEDTIALGRERVIQFHTTSQECAVKFDKNFDFPKMHLLSHLFDDIWKKGVSSNFSTKPGEQMHRALRQAYRTSSKKNSTVDSEILRKSHATAVYELIESEINARNAALEEDGSLENNGDSDNPVTHIDLASKKRLVTLGLVEEEHRGDLAFARLGARVRACIARLDSTFNIPLGSPIKAFECHMLKVQYESMVDWYTHRDILRCSPKVYGKERRDCVLYFVQLGSWSGPRAFEGSVSVDAIKRKSSQYAQLSEAW
ncbi:hypothetical protein BDV93DRAFT_607928 [Ceratobasidium sp. AG-I]|nr:hypothetical protein BDV93DRAFT_607928 [Ceratobasidium sp. AG-I]